MNKSAAESRTLLRIGLTFIAAFLLIQWVLRAVHHDLTRHLGVAVILIMLPLWSSRRNDSIFPDFFHRSRNSWGAIFCACYCLVPVFFLSVGMPGEISGALLNLQKWLFSAPGFAAVIIAPLSEEFFFRGWLLKNQLRRSHVSQIQKLETSSMSSLFWICYFNALLFWLFHIPIQEGFLQQWTDALAQGRVPVSPGPFLLGLVASLLTVLTGTPRAAMGFHMLANALGPLWLPLLGNDSIRSFFYY